MCPGTTDDFIQFIDIRDLAEWLYQLVAQEVCGTFNVTGPTITFYHFLQHCCVLAGNPYPIIRIHVDDYSFEEQCHLFPVYCRNADEFMGYGTTDISRALAAGLKFRPIQTSLQDYVDWHRSRGASYPLQHSMADSLYTELLHHA